MSLRELSTDEHVPVDGRYVVVVIPLFGAHDFFVRCLTSVLANTPRDVPILIADDASPDPASLAWAQDLDRRGVIEHEIWWVRRSENLGFVGNSNAAFAQTSPADVVLLNSDCVVPEGWLDGLRDAVASDSINATATALTNHGSIVSVPQRNHPWALLPQERELDEHARAVRDQSLRLRPRIPAAVGHCVWIRRAALDLVGPFDEAFAPAYGEEVDFSQRCLMQGLQHVLADDVLVFHHGGASLDVGGERSPYQLRHDEIINSRYQYYENMVERVADDRHSSLARALTVASRALRRGSVTIDGRCLTRFVTGTQLHTLELIGALWETKRVDIRVVVPPDLGDYAREILAEMPGLDLTGHDVVVEGIRRTDVVHRPFQVSAPSDIPFLELLGERVIITNQDLIAYRNPGYFASAARWERYRRLTAETMGYASLVLFFSQHAADDALAEDLLPPERARVVPIGVDHRLNALRPEPRAAAGAEALMARPYLLCLGTRFRHKNRVFAMRLLEALRTHHGWDGRLVLAGADVLEGSSNGDEAAWLAARPDMRGDVVLLGAVDEAEKAWLYAHCAAVVYPSSYEGFGLIPFEAAALRKPCFFAPQASLTELLPHDTALITPWDAVRSAEAIIAVLRDPARAEQLVARIAEAGTELTWTRTAERLLDAYDRAVRLPSRDLLRMRGDQLTLDARYWGFRDAVGPTGLALIDPQRPLLPEDVQRAVAALARRSATRGPLLTALRTAYRLGKRSGRENGVVAIEEERSDED